MEVRRPLQNLRANRKRARKARQETSELQALERLRCEANALKPAREIDRQGIFSSVEIETSWTDAERVIDRFAIPDGTGGVNPGDRRAIYYLIRHFRPSSVLEIGTHIGASTLHIATGLSANVEPGEGTSARVVSVDIANVNDPVSKPWLAHGTRLSPAGMLAEMKLSRTVDFVTSKSLDYLSGCRTKFDFIFLDGDHSAKTVYLEIPIALGLLNPGGVILLHDYFPDLEPLWSDGSVIPGPFLATERLRREGANVIVVPLGGSPWATKLQSQATSLALLLGTDAARGS